MGSVPRAAGAAGFASSPPKTDQPSSYPPRQPPAERGSSPTSPDHGFNRPEMRSKPLEGTVSHYSRHIFLCYKDPSQWPAHVDRAEADRLPKMLSEAISARKKDMELKVKLTLCEASEGTECDALVFPDMLRFRGLTHFDVDAFVNEVLVKRATTKQLVGERLSGSWVFVCCHAARDRRCGACGPPLLDTFKEEIADRGLADEVTALACSHVGGHAYAGNVITFSARRGTMEGNWYGYVTPEDVSVLLDSAVLGGQRVARLWRGRMGLSEEEQRAEFQSLSPEQAASSGVCEDCSCGRAQQGREAAPRTNTDPGTSSSNPQYHEDTASQATGGCNNPNEQNVAKRGNAFKDSHTQGVRSQTTTSAIWKPAWCSSWDWDTTLIVAAGAFAAASLAAAWCTRYH